MKSLTGSFILAPDAVSLVVADLPPAFRRGLAYSPDAVIWNRERSRVAPFIVGADSARLLESFKRPCSIPEAVVHYGRLEGCDPSDVMVASYALFREAIERGLLLPESEWAETRIAPILQPGDRAGRWQILASVNVMEDGEVHRAVDAAGTLVALKVAGTPAGAARLAHEAKALSWLDGRVTPRLFEAGHTGEHQFLALEWRQGRHPDLVAESLRAAGTAGRPHLRRLALAILDAYAILHGQGALHGDVHPRNLLVGPAGRVTILDLGYGAVPDLAAPPERAGVAYYFEPEAAVEWRVGRGAPPATPAGEQYAIAALLYQLLSGHTYADFRLDSAEFIAQVIGDRPRPFTALGIAHWPGMEGALARALAKDPTARFPSIAALAKRIRLVSATLARPAHSQQAQWLERELAQLAQPARSAPVQRRERSRISIYQGNAGAAVALLRLACLRNDPALLAAADGLCAWAEFLSGKPRGAERDHPPGALLHAQAGVALTRAALARARADEPELSRAVRWFVSLTRPCLPRAELASGMAGLLLGASRLVAFPELRPGDRRALRGVQRRLAAWLLRECGLAGGPIDSGRWANLGMAHGWCGILYALLAWQESRPGHRAAPALDRWLDQLHGRSVASGRARCWPWLERRNGRLTNAGSMTGWCNGSAGFVLLYLTAHRVLGRPVDLARATAAAHDVCTRPAGSFDLCCGASGSAYALLAMGRATGERRWITRARTLANHAFHHRDLGQDGPDQGQGLFRGHTGLMLLLAELDDPGSATFPLIESLP